MTKYHHNLFARRNIIIIVILLLFNAQHSAFAKDIIAGPVVAYVTSVYDGDTFKADAHIWPGQFIHTSVRVLGVDAPEIHSKCAKELELAEQAKAYVIDLLKSADVVDLRNIQTDKYGGRVEADVYVDNQNLAALLINQNLGRPYFGEKRTGWCD